MQGGDAVDGLTRGEAEVCHVHAAVRNDEVAAHARIVAEAGAQLVAPAAVDLADDLPHARQLALDEPLRPGLERLGHDGVVRVVDAGGDDGPRLVPAEAVVIEQQAHELGDDERRVRVVDLDDVVLGKVAHRAVARAMGAQDALRRRGDEEILLADAQGLALDVVVRRVEHLRDDLGHRALLETLDIAAGGEEIHVEVVRAVRLPEAEGVDAPVAIRGDEHVARHGQHALIAAQLAVVVAVGVPMRLDAAAEAHLDRVLMARHEPARGGRAPVVRDLGLPAADDALPENAQLVAQRIAGGGDALGGEAVHIARGKAAETAVAETGVRLGLKDVGRAAAEVLQRAGERVADAEVERVLHQGAPHEKLHRQVVHLTLGRGAAVERVQAREDLADDDGRGLKDLLVGRGLGRDAEVCAELVGNGAAQLIAGNLIGHWHKIECSFTGCVRVRARCPWGSRSAGSRSR